VGGLAVNQRREAVLCVRLDALPDVQHRPAGRVDHDAADFAQRLKIPDGDTERRQDDDIGWANS
jgi:hypothetical protein